MSMKGRASKASDMAQYIRSMCELDEKDFGSLSHFFRPGTEGNFFVRSPIKTFSKRSENREVEGVKAMT